MKLISSELELQEAIISESHPEWWLQRLAEVYHRSAPEAIEMGWVGDSTKVYCELKMVQYQMSDGSPSSSN
jgi:hypothetical protein